jgi:hypothetical protein
MNAMRSIVRTAARSIICVSIFTASMVLWILVMPPLPQRGGIVRGGDWSGMAVVVPIIAAVVAYRLSSRLFPREDESPRR